MTQPDKSDSFVKSRCDICGKRIGPARYELGLCPQHEALFQFYKANFQMVFLLRLLRDPRFLKRLEESSASFAKAIKTAMGE